MTVLRCTECGERFSPRSQFEADCPQCGSEELESEEAYDPPEYELKCEYCGYEIDVSSNADADWDGEQPTTVDDPCPICASALVPKSQASSPRDLPEYGVARGAAKKLHREHQIPGPPYDVSGVAAALGLIVAIGNYQHDGLLTGTTIEVPTSATEAVRRFVIAHEIGHYILRHQGGREKAEPEANALASELLVPAAQLKSEISRTPSIRALCRTFGVSRQAMVYAVMSARSINRVTG